MANIKVVRSKRVKQCWEDRIFDIVCNGFLVFFVIIVLYPIWFVVIASFSDPTYVNSGALTFLPKGFTFFGYEKVVSDSKIWVGYGNTIIYTVCGSVLGLCMTMMAGYASSRKNVFGNNVLMLLFMFTMYFSGGTIPTYIVIQSLGLLDTRFLMCILGCFSVYNMIITRSFIANSIPEELNDAARIDGCGIGKYFYLVVLPLSKAVMAVNVLYIAVSFWNSYFPAMMYLTDSMKEPLQLYLRQVLISAQAKANAAIIGSDMELAEKMAEAVELIKYATIVISTAPILCIYPFVQKYFVKGVMIGSVKG